MKISTYFLTDLRVFLYPGMTFPDLCRRSPIRDHMIVPEQLKYLLGFTAINSHAQTLIPLSSLHHI